jgi:Ras-related protein Rab-24
MSRVYYRSAKAALVCYDVTNMKSWEKVKFWVEELVSNEPTCKVYILGNMMDKVLEDGQFRLVSSELVDDYAQQVNARAFETSAKTNMNIDHVFEVVAQDFVSRGSDQVVEYSPISLESTDEPKDPCPC